MPSGNPSGPKHCHVGRLDAEGVPVVEADLAERRDGGNGQVALRRLGIGGPGGFVVFGDLLPGGRADRVSAIRDGVMDVAADKAADDVVLEGVCNVGVGDAVLDGPQVDVRQRRLPGRW